MDALMTMLESTVTSPWLYLLVIAVVAVDCVVPVLPGETMVITAAAYAAAMGAPQVVPLVLAALVGAVLGDVLAHHIGRGAGPLTRRLRRAQLGATLFTWAERGLLRRGGVVIVAARFIPGGRTATTLASGVIGYPRRKFLVYVGIAGAAWSIYNVAIGYAGGVVFQDNPLIGVAIGIGLALVVGIGVERIRILRERRVAAQQVHGGATAPPADRDGSPADETSPPVCPAAPVSHARS